MGSRTMSNGLQWSPMAMRVKVNIKAEGRAFSLGGARIGLRSVHVRLSSRPSALDIHHEVARKTAPSAKSDQVFGAKDWTGLDRTPPLGPRRFLVGRHLILQGPPTEIFLVAATNAPANPAKSIAGYMDGTVTSWARH